MIEPQTWKQRGFEIKFMGVGDDDNKIWLDFLLYQYLASEGKKLIQTIADGKNPLNVLFHGLLAFPVG